MRQNPKKTIYFISLFFQFFSKVSVFFRIREEWWSFLIMPGGRKRSSTRDVHFTDTAVPRRKKCRYCDWEHCDNNTALEKHLKDHHQDLLDPDHSGPSHLQVAPPFKNFFTTTLHFQTTFKRYVDRLWTGGDQDKCEKLLALYQVAYFVFPPVLHLVSFCR
jgi:hypothetical protein